MVRGRLRRPGRSNAVMLVPRLGRAHGKRPRRNPAWVGGVDHRQPQVGELGHGLGRAADVVQLDVGHHQAEQRAGLGHPVVGVGLPLRSAQQPRVDGQAVVGLPSRGCPAARARSPARPAGRSRGRGCGRCRAGEWCRSASAATAATTGVSSLAAAQVEVDRRASWLVPRTVRPRSSKLDVGAERGQDVADRIAGLVRSAGPVRHGHRSAGDRGRGQERRGVGQVGLDAYVLARRDRSGRDHPAVGLGVVDPHVPVAEHGHGHLDVRPRGERRPVVPQVQPVRVAGRRPAAGR